MKIYVGVKGKPFLWFYIDKNIKTLFDYAHLWKELQQFQKTGYRSTTESSLLENMFLTFSKFHFYATPFFMQSRVLFYFYFFACRLHCNSVHVKCFSMFTIGIANTKFIRLSLVFCLENNKIVTNWKKVLQNCGKNQKLRMNI